MLKGFIGPDTLEYGDMVEHTRTHQTGIISVTQALASGDYNVYMLTETKALVKGDSRVGRDFNIATEKAN